VSLFRPFEGAFHVEICFACSPCLLGLLTLSGCGINNIPTYDEAAKPPGAKSENQYSGAPT